MPKSKSFKPAEKLSIPVSSSIRAFKYLSLQGGGMKGIGEIGAIEELEKNAVLAQIEEVAGSSAGGLMATLIAIGCTAKEIREFMLKLDFISLQDKSELGWVESTRLKEVLKGGVNLASGITPKINALKSIPFIGGLLNQVTNPYTNKLDNLLEYGKKVATIFTQIEKGEEIVRLALGSELGLWQGEALICLLAEIIAKKTGNPNITFKELAALTKGTDSPFKKLILTGSNITDQKLEYYSANDTPDMPIIEAARISASFPGAYKPVVKIEKKDGELRQVVRLDGGLLENLPDVFHREPYLTPGEKHNSKVLALSFKTDDEDNPKTMKNIFQLAQALYTSKMSEKALIGKYGSNIAFIDTLGIGTLEFSLSDERREALAQAGVTAVRETFKKILNGEKQKRKNKFYFSKISNEELIRIIVELEHSTSEEVNEDYNNFLLELENRDIDRNELESLRDTAKRIYSKRQKLINHGIFTDEELSRICKRKREELANTEKILEKKLNDFELAKSALEHNHKVLQQRFLEHNGKNEFRADLEKLYNIEQRLKDKRTERETNHQAKSREKNYQQIKLEKEQLYKTIIEKYQQDALMVGFFQNLKEDSYKPHFIVPTNRQEFNKHGLEDIQRCEAHIEQARKERDKSKQELQFFKQQMVAFKHREVKFKKFHGLLQLKTELDKSIARKSTLITKMNHYLLEKAPKLQRIITPFFKAVSFLSFVGTLPVAVPVVPVVKAIEKLSSQKETQETAREVVNYFRWPDIHQERKLREIREVTARCIKIMQDNYLEAQDKELTALYQLHAIYLEKSGISLDKIFVKKPEESPQSYQQRIKTLKSHYTPNLSPTSYANLDELEVALKTKKNEEPVQITSESGFGKHKFMSYCKNLVDHLKIKTSNFKFFNNSFKMHLNKCHVQINYIAETETISTTLPDELQALKKVFPAVAEAWKASHLANPILSGPFANIEYMTKELLKRHIKPDFDPEVIKILKDAGFVNPKDFLRALQEKDRAVQTKAFLNISSRYKPTQ